ncbi:MAG: hypothetical protein QNJ46_34560, partial [Leptolyngbyaceae cyanobacterium MO_188.B28]|nr:hypothetical protein [Leptolyngbyaceae cyanobacterium MO_188.B28]
MARIWRVFLTCIQYLLRKKNTRFSPQNSDFQSWLRSPQFWYGALAFAIALCCTLKSPVQAIVAQQRAQAGWIAQAASQPENEAQRLERLGQAAYASKQFQDAATAFQQAAQVY